MTKDLDPFDTVGIEKTLAILAREYIRCHCIERDGQKIYQGDLGVLQWYQAYDNKQREARATQKPEGGLTAIQKGV